MVSSHDEVKEDNGPDDHPVDPVKPVNPTPQNNDLPKMGDAGEVPVAEEPVKPRSRLSLPKPVVTKAEILPTPEVVTEKKIVVEVIPEIGHPDKVVNPVVQPNKFSNNSKSR